MTWCQTWQRYDTSCRWLTSATTQQPTMFSADYADASIRCHDRHDVNERRQCQQLTRQQEAIWRDRHLRWRCHKGDGLTSQWACSTHDTGTITMSTRRVVIDAFGMAKCHPDGTDCRPPARTVVWHLLSQQQRRDEPIHHWSIGSDERHQQSWIRGTTPFATPWDHEVLRWRWYPLKIKTKVLPLFPRLQEHWEPTQSAHNSTSYHIKQQINYSYKTRVFSLNCLLSVSTKK